MSLLFCTRCNDFKQHDVFSKLANFRAIFAFLHKDHSEAFNTFLEVAKKKSPLEEIYQEFKNLYGDDYAALNEAEVAAEILLCEGNIPKVRTGVALIVKTIKEDVLDSLTKDEEDALINKTIQSWKKSDGFRFGYGGSVSPAIYFDEVFTKSEAQTMLRMELDEREANPQYEYLHLTLSLESPIQQLERDFKALIKRKKLERRKEMHKNDARLRGVPFDLWEKYIIVYILKKKSVIAKNLIPDLPEKRLNRHQITEYVFGEVNDDTLQKTDRYVKAAEKLIGEARKYEGLFTYCRRRCACHLGYHQLHYN